jgi:hypothetical protein
MSMMDSDLKKWAKKAALIHSAAPFLKALQAICVAGTEDDNADNSTTDDNTDNDTDDDADDNFATQTMDDNVDNNTACR